MALIIEPVYTDGIAQLSYLVGDDSEGFAAVIDPRPDCDIYVKKAQEMGLEIKAIYETHIHADFMSGSLALQKKLGGEVPVRVSGEGNPEYKFRHEKIVDGHEAKLGNLRIVARHTPGHTPEHLSYFAYEGSKDTPFALFSGDTLFVDSVGRPDLLGEEETQDLAENLYHSIHRIYANIPDGVMLYPGHGAGSACGPKIGDRMFSTIGYEKGNNPYFKLTEKEDFIEEVLGAAPEEPNHYRPLKKLNASDAKERYEQKSVRALNPAEVERVACDGAKILDTRSALSFASGHIPGSLNIEAKGELSVWSGWLLEFDTPLILVLEKDSDLEKVRALLLRTGHYNVVGYLSGGIMEWIMEGKAVSTYDPYTAPELKDYLGLVQVLDVRSESERKNGYIPSSKHIFLPDLEEQALNILDPNEPVVTYCASGFRASIAASILKKIGFENVGSLPGSWVAWKQSELPVEKDEKRELQPA
ncbi:MBL fold metallo-hydrolase [Pelagicoccus albus]|uniref:MBL fold metallo-hydrolase n=1 Tax=Pelagicoccus albus TaxID=415222 RepID=A0A7X1E9G2_9BACT|nr:MBL fold metallo-hydrolase [Pelagicoccus albus]MBC2607820.1 MBL fold metallo-hydrolase [Pelagicoccus albus]